MGALEGAPHALPCGSPSPAVPSFISPPGLQASRLREDLPTTPPAAQPGFCLDPATLPPSLLHPSACCLPTSLPKLSPLAVATEGLAGVPGTTPQRPASRGPELGTVPVCLAGLRVQDWLELPPPLGGGRCEVRPSGLLKVTLLFSPSIPVQPLSLLPHLEEGGGKMTNRQRTEKPREE